MNMPVVVNNVVTPYRPPVYMANPMMNQPIIYPDCNPFIPMIQGYQTYPTYPAYPMVQEPIMPTIQVQAPPTTIIKERYLPSPSPAPRIHYHSTPRMNNNISTPNTIINKITNAAPIINTPPPPMRHIHIDRASTIKFPRSFGPNAGMGISNSPPQQVIKPAMKTITTINRTTRRSTTKGGGRR